MCNTIKIEIDDNLRQVLLGIIQRSNTEHLAKNLEALGLNINDLAELPQNERLERLKTAAGQNNN